MSPTTDYDERPPGLPPGLGPLIASVTARGRQVAPVPAQEPSGVFAPEDAAALLAELGPIGAPPPPAVPPGLRRAAPPGELDGVTCMAGVPERPTIPLDLGDIPLYLARADMTLAFGAGAIGKGRMTWSLIAQVTSDGGEAIVILPEDKEDEQMAPRGHAAGADMGHVWNMTRLPGSAARFKLSAAEKQEGHIAYLRAFIELLKRTCQNLHANLPGTATCAECGAAMRDPRLVIIDPISAVVGWGTMQTVAGARRLVEPLQDLADETGVTIFAIGHTTKDGKLAGSAGLQQALRLIYRIAVDPMNGAYRIITVEKGNNLPPNMDGLRFTITEDASGRARVDWLTKAALEQRRTSWRDRLPEREPAASPHAPTALPAAQWRAHEATFQGGATVGRRTLGPHRTREAAQLACAAVAGAALSWRPSARTPGAWVATIWPDGPGGREVGYAVYSATRG